MDLRDLTHRSLWTAVETSVGHGSLVKAGLGNGDSPDRGIGVGQSFGNEFSGVTPTMWVDYERV